MQLSEEQKKEIIENREVIEKNIRRSAALQRVFRGPDGELALDEIDELCNYKEDAFDADPYIHARNAGRRSVAICIHTAINDDPEMYRKVLDAQNREGREPE